MSAYLDYNATSPLTPAARKAWLAAQDQAWGNPASIHTIGQQARHHVDQAKGTLARLLGCSAGELIVTSGGSEANATAIRAALGSSGGLACCSAIEHSSVLRNVEAYAGSVRLLPVDGAGRLHSATVSAAIDTHTRLLCVQFANNELGTYQDVVQIVAAARAVHPTLWIHCDAAQGPGKVTIDVRALGVDSVAIAGHKFGAPKGVGLLWLRAGRVLPPLIAGGRQQQDRRSGTEDAALVCAMAAALTERLTIVASEDARQRQLLDACFARIKSQLPQVRWLAQEASRTPNTLSLAHPGVGNEALVTRLDLAGYAVSKGAACMAARGEPSHVIAALGLPREVAVSAIRISIGPSTTAAELTGFSEAYVVAVKGMLVLA